jgi:hypothetical protein
MPTTYAKNKKHIYKWLEHNQDRHREINRKNQRKYEAWKRIQKIYFNILLDN